MFRPQRRDEVKEFEDRLGRIDPHTGEHWLTWDEWGHWRVRRAYFNEMHSKQRKKDAAAIKPPTKEGKPQWKQTSTNR